MDSCYKIAQKTFYFKNKDKILPKQIAYNRRNKESIAKRRAIWKKTYRLRLEVKISDNLRRRIRSVLKGENKSAKTEKLLGCTFEEFKIYLESKFKPGMSWDNYGMFGWHMDHIKPCSSFNLKDPEEQRKCFHFSNLQPLWAKDNLSKKAKF